MKKNVIKNNISKGGFSMAVVALNPRNTREKLNNLALRAQARKSKIKNKVQSDECIKRINDNFSDLEKEVYITIK